jgi:hypothetical protein
MSKVGLGLIGFLLFFFETDSQRKLNGLFS